MEQPLVKLIGSLVLVLSLLVACSEVGTDATSATSEPHVTTGPTTTTEPDGSLDCLTTVSYVSIPEYPADQIGELTRRGAAERYAAFEGHDGALTEVEPSRFAIIDQGRETVIIEVSEAPAGGYLGGPMRGCA